MKIIQPASYVIMSALFALLCTAAHADIGKIGGRAIGKIGSPVVPSNMPKSKGEKKDAQDEEGENETQENVEATPLLSITFNQRRINFGRLLDQAIVNQERENPGSNYEVISRVSSPKGGASNVNRLNQVYSRNLGTVIQRMNKIGITSDRIRSSTQYNTDNSPQEITVFRAE